MRAILLAMATLLGLGCVHTPYRIDRRVGGQERAGVFVSPYSYEHFIRGELARQRGDVAEAAAEFEMARAGAADDPLLIARLAEAREGLGQRDEVDRLLSEGERSFPRAQAIFIARARIAEARGRSDDAIAAWARAVELAEGDDDPVLELARVLRESGRQERADAVLEEAAARGGVVALRARLAVAIAARDGSTAAQSALLLLRRAPGARAEILDAVGLAVDDGHPTLALRVLSRLPEDTAPALLLRVRIAAGDRAAAERQLGLWAPADAGQSVEAARAWLALGRPETAAEVAEEAIALGAGHDAQVVLAEAQLRAGHPGAAATGVAPFAARDPAAGALLRQALSAGGLEELAGELAQRGVGASTPDPGDAAPSP